MAEALSVVKFGQKGVKSKELREREGGREREREKKREVMEEEKGNGEE